MTLRFPQKKNFVANVGTGKPIKVINLIKKIFTALKINFRRDIYCRLKNIKVIHLLGLRKYKIIKISKMVS